MQGRELFTKQEWALVAAAPSTAGAMVTALDFGVVSFAKEIAATTKSITSAGERFPGNTVIQAILAELETGAEEPSGESAEQLTLEVALRRIGEATQLVGAKAPEQVAGYKRLIYEAAESAANASGSGFLGSGKKLSDDEAAYLSRLRGVLEL